MATVVPLNNVFPELKKKKENESKLDISIDEKRSTKVKPSTGVESLTDNIIRKETGVQSKSRFKLMTIQKIKRIIKNYVTAGLTAEMIDDYLENLVTFEYLGEKLHGLAWKGDRNDEKQLLTDMLKSTMLYLKEEKSESDRNNNAQYFALFAFLEFCSELLIMMNVVFLFLENKHTAGWILAVAICLGRIFQVIVIFVYEKQTLASYMIAITGLKIIVDAYFLAKYGRERIFRGATFEIGYTASIRRCGVFIIQSVPQVIVNLHIIFTSYNNSSNDNYNGLFYIQVLGIVFALISCSIANAKYVYDANKRHADEKSYLSMSNFITFDSLNRQLIFACMCLWYMMHFLIVSMGVAALIAFASLLVKCCIFIGSFVFANLIKFIFRGHVYYHKRIKKPSCIKNIISIIGPMILFYVGAALMPVSVVRQESILGPTAFGVTWVSSYCVSIVSVFIYVKVPHILAFFGAVCLMNTFVMLIFFASIHPGSWKTFFWSTRTFKTTIRQEIWNDLYYGSTHWKEPRLYGDKDAHYAGLVVKCLDSDLPWDLITEWLISKKDNFKSNPPEWFTEEWIDFIPPNIQKQIWTNEEIESLRLRMPHWNEARKRARQTKFGFDPHVRVISKKKTKNELKLHDIEEGKLPMEKEKIKIEYDEEEKENVNVKEEQEEEKIKIKDDKRSVKIEKTSGCARRRSSIAKSLRDIFPLIAQNSYIVDLHSKGELSDNLCEIFEEAGKLFFCSSFIFIHFY